MKNIYKLFCSIFVLLLFVGCEENFSDSTDFANVAPPTNVSASFEVTQDNTGLVTITPSGEGAISFIIDYGDGSNRPSPTINNGGNVQHIYAEGSYTVKVTATGLNGLTAVGEVPLTVSFKAPENLAFTIENDAAVSKQVNVTATADYATMFEFHPGIAGVDPATANIGEALSYQYAEAGTYTVRVVAKGAAIETTELTQEFEVTAILAPTVSAPEQPDRPSATVVSVYSNKYQDINGVNFYPNWGQTTQFVEYDLNGDKMLQYSTVNYQGIEFGGNYDLSSFEYMHVDVWTASPEFENLEISLISPSNGEKPVLGKLDQDKWTSLDIPLSEWTNQGLTIADIFQLKLAINPWNPSGAGTIFLDNLYFWKANSVELPIKFDNEEKFEGKGGFTFALSTNPDDSSDNTGKITTSEAEWDTAEISLDVPIQIATGADNRVSVRVYSPNDDIHRVMMKLENIVDPSDRTKNEYIEISKNITGKGWHDVTFDISELEGGNQAYPNNNDSWDGNGSFERLIFFIDPGQCAWYGTCSNTYNKVLDFHIDDIVLGTHELPLYPLFDDFEGNGSITWAADAVGMSVVDNPHGSGKVLKYEDTGGDYANVRFDLRADHSAKFDLSTNNIFKFKIYIPSADLTGNQDNKVELKLQDGSKDRPWEGQHGVSTMLELDKWNNVYIDFSEKSSSTEFSRIVLQVNGEGNNDNVTAYIDDFYYEIPQSHDDFEGNGNIAKWEEEPGLESMQIIDNPVKGSINSSNKVLEYYDGGSKQYANIRYYLASDNSISFDLTNANKVTLDVYMPSADLTGSQDNKLWLKLQNGNKERPWEGQITKEQPVELDKWQRLTFDFSDQSSATEFTRMLVQFNGEDNFDSVKAYIDNVFIHR